MRNPLRKHQPPYSQAEITQAIDDISSLRKICDNNHEKIDAENLASAKAVLQFYYQENEYWKSGK